MDGADRSAETMLAAGPLDGRNPPSRGVLFALLAESRAAGAAIVASTHRPDVIAAAGRLTYDGPPDFDVFGEIFDRSELE